MSWVRIYITSSGITKSNSWRQVGGTKYCQVHLWEKHSILSKKGSWKIQGSENQLEWPVDWLPRTSSHSRVKERNDKDLANDWQTIKGRLKNWLELALPNQPLESRVCPGGNSTWKRYFPTTPLMDKHDKVITGAGVNSHENPSLGKQCFYSYQNPSIVAVDSHLHRVNLIARRSTHQRPQGKTENHQANVVLSQPWAFVESQ